LLATSKTLRRLNRQHPANTATSQATMHQLVAEHRTVSDSDGRGLVSTSPLTRTRQVVQAIMWLQSGS
jgi:hypothetical protein